MDRLPDPRNSINHDSWLMDRLSTSINHPLFLSLPYEIYKNLHRGVARFLNPLGAWVREQYPEKLLKHHILKQGFSYKMINVTDQYVSPYAGVALVKVSVL